MSRTKCEVKLVDVSKRVFDAIAGKCEKGTELFSTVVVNYSGTHLYGDVTVSVNSAENLAIEKVLDVIKNAIYE